MDILRKKFGEKLRAARKRIRPKMTQARLAELTGVEPPSVSRWETGKDFPEGFRMPDIYKAVGVDAEYFGLEPIPNGSESPQNTRNVYQLRPDPKAAQAMQEAQQVLKELAEDVPQILRLSAIYLLLGDRETELALLALPGGARRVAILGKLRAVP